MKQLEKLPFFELDIKETILPLGMIEYSHENESPCYWVQQVLFLYKGKLYIIESLDDDKKELGFFEADIEDIGNSYFCADRELDKIEYTYFLMNEPESFYCVEKDETLLLRFDNDRWNGIEFSNSDYWDFNGWYSTSDEYLENETEFQYSANKEEFISRIKDLIK